MDKKEYEKPSIEIMEFECSDIIATSGESAMMQQSLFDGDVNTGSKNYSLSY